MKEERMKEEAAEEELKAKQEKDHGNRRGGTVKRSWKQNRRYGNKNTPVYLGLQKDDNDTEHYKIIS